MPVSLLPKTEFHYATNGGEPMEVIKALAFFKAPVRRKTAYLPESPSPLQQHGEVGRASKPQWGQFHTLTMPATVTSLCAGHKGTLIYLRSLVFKCSSCVCVCTQVCACPGLCVCVVRMCTCMWLRGMKGKRMEKMVQDHSVPL